MTDETAARLAQIRAREQAATPGPWTWTPGMIQASGDEIIMWPANIPLCDDDELDAAMRLGTCGQHAEDHAEDNLAFLAAAREDVPWLLNLVDQLRARIDAVRELGERIAEGALEDVLAEALRFRDELDQAIEALRAEIPIPEGPRYYVNVTPRTGEIEPPAPWPPESTVAVQTYVGSPPRLIGDADADG